MVTIRDLRTPAELAAANRVVARAWHAAFDDIVSAEALAYVDSLADGLDHDARFEEIVGHDRSRAVVAVDGSAVVGNAWIVWAPRATKSFATDDDAEVRILYVDPDRWGEGIGTTLLDRCIDSVPAVLDRVVVETLSENDAGRAFYEANGFDVVERSTFDIAGSTYPTVVYARPV